MSHSGDLGVELLAQTPALVTQCIGVKLSSAVLHARRRQAFVARNTLDRSTAVISQAVGREVGSKQTSAMGCTSTKEADEGESRGPVIVPVRPYCCDLPGG